MVINRTVCCPGTASPHGLTGQPVRIVDQISYTCMLLCLKLNCETNKLITSRLPKPVPYPNLLQYLKEQGTISPKRYFWRQYSDTTGEVTDTSGEVIDISGEVIDVSGDVLTPGTCYFNTSYIIKWCNSFTSELLSSFHHMYTQDTNNLLNPCFRAISPEVCHSAHGLQLEA